MKRTLALCADDFGQAPGISAGIVRLAAARRLSAISCITNLPHWSVDAPLLRGLPDSVDLGLHFNLTEGAPLSPRLARLWPQLPGLGTLLARAHLGLLPRGALRSEFQAQVRAFIETTGKAPRYIDGHQHVHALPIVRELILDAVEHTRPLPALRCTGRILGPGFALKRRIIERSGGRALRRQLVQRELAHNPALLGVYDFSETPYRALMQGWLKAVPSEGALLFCHPGDASVPAAADAIATARQREIAYLESADFAFDLAQAGVALGRVWQVSRRSSGG